jgi:hypothetical protein
VSILREMYKRALLMDSVVNLLACVKHQEWQVSLNYRNCMYPLHLLVYENKSIK